jgi:hypothetical protein
MNREDLKLERLFAAARDAQAAPAEEMPPYLANRVLAHWRSGGSKDDSWPIIKLLFRRGLACAAIVMLFALAWGYDGLDVAPENDEAYANYELRADLMP